jgi:hypothetical protein
MGLRRFAAVFTAVAACALLAASPAEAAVKKKKTYATRGIVKQQTVFVSRGEDGRRRTRILVQRRSYLDAGTEVMPGDRKYNDYAMPPNYSVTGVIDNTPFSHRSPLYGPFDLPSKNNPFAW